jgi:hypothetical protein
MDHGENKHCIETPWADCYHYKQGEEHVRSCGVKDAPNRVELMPHSKRYPTLSFELPRQKYELEKVITMMHEAYQRGSSDRGKSIGKMLKDLCAL